MQLETTFAAEKAKASATFEAARTKLQADLEEVAVARDDARRQLVTEKTRADVATEELTTATARAGTDLRAPPSRCKQRACS